MSNLSVIGATDFSDRSAHVAGRAAQLARHLGARLILVHVGHHDAATTPSRFSALGLGRGKNHSENDLQALASEHGAEFRMLSGDPSEALATLAEDENAALIVLGLHKERRAMDVLRLTTMEKIVLAAPRPVLIAHQPPSRAYLRVLAPTNFSEASAASLIMAARIAPDARFYAVHALQLPIGAIFKRGSSDTEAALDRAETRSGQFLATPGLPVLAEMPEIVPGGVHQVLEFRREELAADLICIGDHSGRDPGTLGNYARDLMRAPHTDLLVAKPR